MVYIVNVSIVKHLVLVFGLCVFITVSVSPCGRGMLMHDTIITILIKI